MEETLFSKEKYLFSGVGFVFTEESGIIGIDIDHCLTDGQPNETAAAILAKLPPTYIEVSPSGSGLHIFLRGKLPVAGSRSSKHGVEIYASGRYFTMTGNRWRDCADSIADYNGASEWIQATFITSKRNKQAASASPTVLTDDELLALARASKDSVAFEKLYRGGSGKTNIRANQKRILLCAASWPFGLGATKRRSTDCFGNRV